MAFAKESTLHNVKKDLLHYSRFCCGGKPLWRVLLRILYTHPGAAAVIWYRLGSFAWRCRVPVLRQWLQVVYISGLPFVRMYSGVQIQPHTKIGPGLIILHFGGVVITRECEIGSDCVLYHNVSLVTMKNRQGPRIGANFYAGVGTTIIGDIVIEDNVTVGAGSVVTKSIPADVIVAGAPARILRPRHDYENNAENKTARRQPPRWMEPPKQRTPQQPASHGQPDET